MSLNISTYQYSTPSSVSVTIADLTLYFSYQTVIAFRDKGVLTISENYWSVTTGKHLNAINSDKSVRIAEKPFQTALVKCLKRHKFNISDI